MPAEVRVRSHAPKPLLPLVAPEVLTGSQADQDAARRDLERSPQALSQMAANDQQRDSGPSR